MSVNGPTVQISTGPCRTRLFSRRTVLVTTKVIVFFLWRVDPADDEETMLRRNAAVIKDIEKDIPVYHTRCMRRQFQEKVSRLSSSKPAVLCALYHELTGDASCSANSQQKAVDDRLRFILTSDDPDLVWNLRELNNGQPEQFSHF